MSSESLREIMRLIPDLTHEQRQALLAQLQQIDSFQSAPVPVIRAVTSDDPPLIVEAEVDGVSMRYPADLLIRAFTESPVGMAIQSWETGSYTINRAYGDFTGMSVEDVAAGRRESASRTYVDMADWERHLKAMTETGQIVNDVVLARTPRGERWHLVNAVTVMIGGLPHYLLTVQDIHDLKMLEQQVQTANNKLQQRLDERTRDFQLTTELTSRSMRQQAMTELLPQMADLIRTTFDLYHVSVLLLTPDRTELSYSAWAGDQTGLSFNVPVPITGPGLIAEAARTRRIIVLNDVLAARVDVEHHSLPDLSSELIIPLTVGADLLGVIVYDADQPDRFPEDEQRVFTTFAEQLAVTIQNARLLDELREAYRLAEQANVIKSTFLSHLSHELRTPLNAILSFSAFVGNGLFGPVNEEQKDAMDKVRTSGNHLLSLINDVLDISKIEAGRMTLFIEPFDLSELMAEIVAVAEGLMPGKGVELAVDIEDGLPILQADKRRVRQVFLNLLSNSVKFTTEGTIRLSVAREGDFIRASVADTGSGIPAEKLPTIFESFTQVEQHARGRGTGLGLPITRHFVEAHQGDIRVESEEGKGTTFTFTLAIKNEPDALPAAAK